MTVLIHNKEYITVAERLAKAQKDIQSIGTEVLYTEPRVVIKATLVLKSGEVFTGISAANVNKSIEKESPYEVAETSAVGRALAFAGYETTNGIASAEEMLKATRQEAEEKQSGCEHLKTSKHQVMKEGKNKGKWFIGCDTCRKFIGFTDAPTDEKLPEIVTNYNGSKSVGKVEYSEPH